MQRPGAHSLAQELVDEIAEWSLTENGELPEFHTSAVEPSPRTVAMARNLLAAHRAFRNKAHQVLFRTVVLAAGDSKSTTLPYRYHSWNTIQEILSCPGVSSTVRQFGFVGATSLERINHISARCPRVDSLIVADVDLALLETVQSWTGPTQISFAGISGSLSQIPAAKRLAPSFTHLKLLRAWDLQWQQVARPFSLDRLSLQVTRRRGRIPLHPEDTVYVGIHARRVHVVVSNGNILTVDHALRGVEGVEFLDLDVTGSIPFAFSAPFFPSNDPVVECEPVFHAWQGTELRLTHWTNLKHVAMRFHYSSALAIARTLMILSRTTSLHTTRLTVFLLTCGPRHRARTENTLQTFSRALLHCIDAGGTLELKWVWVIGYMDPAACLPDRQWQRVLATPQYAEQAFPDRVVVTHHGVHARNMSSWDWSGRVAH